MGLNIKMKALVLILCFAVAATVAKPPIGGDDCSDCVNHCKTVKKVKYVEEYDQKCHNEHKEKCTYKTTYKEVCTDEKKKVCEKFWKEDGYGGKIWTEDPSSCHWLEADECHDEPKPKKVCEPVTKDVCEKVHKNKPYQHECQVCGGEEKECTKLDTKYHSD